MSTTADILTEGGSLILREDGVSTITAEGAAADASTFNPAWAHSSNVVIGGDLT